MDRIPFLIGGGLVDRGKDVIGDASKVWDVDVVLMDVYDVDGVVARKVFDTGER
jgi:hypothetical protein